MERRLGGRRSTARFGVTIAIAMVATGIAFAACDVHSPTAPGRLVSITLTPNASTLAINGTQQFAAVGRDADGVSFPIVPTWSVVANGGAITSAGMFTAGTVPGNFPATVTASLGGTSATAGVTVIAGPLASITVTPSPVTLVVGATQQFVAVGKDSAGNVVALTPTWSTVAGGGEGGRADLSSCRRPISFRAHGETAQVEALDAEF